MIKLRTSNHDLAIETGRRNQIERSRRLCSCKSDIEDEIHFLKYCENFQQIRDEYNVKDQPIHEILSETRYKNYVKTLITERKKIKDNLKV